MKLIQCLSLLFLLFSSTAFATQAKPIGHFESGQLYQKNKVNIVVLNGNYHEMGRQYGALMKNPINEFYQDYIVKQIIKNKKNYQKIENAFGKDAWKSYPARIQQLFLGMSETSGLTANQLVLIDQNFMLTFITYEMGMCSTLSTWGSYTKNGEMLVGHNLDWMPVFQQKYSTLLTVIVFNPNDGSHPSASINYAGGLYPISGLNNKGLYINVHDGSDSMGTIFHKDRTMYIGDMLGFLWDSSSLSMLNKEIITTRANFPMIINAANSKKAYAYEDAPQQVIRREGSNGLLVSTNHFIAKQWGIMTFSGNDFSQQRYQHLLNLAQQNKGKIDVTRMQQIMEKPLFQKNGQLASGATEYQAHKNLSTLTAYQIIAEPATQTIWLRVPNHGDWTKIDLKSYFRQSVPLS